MGARSRERRLCRLRDGVALHRPSYQSPSKAIACMTGPKHGLRDLLVEAWPNEFGLWLGPQTSSA
jgi:hypothetical protein